MGTMLQDLRYGIRMLVKSPGFTILAVVTLGLGIGANAAIFSVVEGVLLKPLPYPQPERLVSARHSAPGLNMKDLEAAPSTYFIYREQSQTFEDIGIYQGDSVSVTGLAEPEQVRTLDVTDSVLPVLGIPPMLGRWFTRADDSPQSPDTAVLTYAYWIRKFGGDRSAIGKTITVDGKLRHIVGIMPQSFQFLDRPDLAMFLPLKLDRSKTFLGQFSFDGIARLKPGVTLKQANADVARMIPIVERTFPAPPGFDLKLFENARIGPNIRPLKEEVVGDVGEVLWVLMGGIGLVLLIACANVANLLLVRAEGRQQELAIRSALGASRGRIAAGLLIESFLLALLGSVLGLALAYGSLRILVALAPTGLPRLSEITINSPVILFTLVLSLIVTLLFGSVPVFKYAGLGAWSRLRESGLSMSPSRERHRARGALVIVQVALAIVLLISSGLMLRTFRALIRVQPGYLAPAEVQTLRVFIPESEVKEPKAVAHMQEELLHKIAAIPGVFSVALGNSVPMDESHWSDPVFAKDRVYTAGDLPLRRFKFIAPGYFKTLGIPLLAGRDLTWDDIYDMRPVAIVSEKMAREYWHDTASALGKQVRVSTTDDWREVVGVVGDIHDDGVNVEPPTIVYWPILMAHFESDPINQRREVAFAIRSSRAGSANLMKEVQQAVWSVDSNLPLAAVHTLDYFCTRSMARTSFTLVMLAVAGGMALLLGVVGLYGVIAYSVSQRTHEIGIRVALGAGKVDVLRLILGQGMILALIGVGIGIGGALGLTRFLSGFLYAVKTTDPLTFVSVAFVLTAVALIASYIPARRAAQVDPMVALRYE